MEYVLFFQNSWEQFFFLKMSLAWVHIIPIPCYKIISQCKKVCILYGQKRYKIKVCFCLQKRMSPPIPQTVVIGKKSIWVTNKIKLQWITKKIVFNPWNTKKIWSKVLKQGLQVLSHIVMAKFRIPENCSAYVPMVLKESCSSKINGLVMKTFSGK